MAQEYNFSNVVIVEGRLIGIVVKSWHSAKTNSYNHDVYVRAHNGIRNYQESEMRHYIFNKLILDEEIDNYI